MTIEKRVRRFKTKYKEGFTSYEIDTLLGDFPDLDLQKFNNALKGTTCIMIDGETIAPPCDVELALHCGVEKRIPDTEFTHFCTGDMPSSDEMYRDWLIARDKKKDAESAISSCQPHKSPIKLYLEDGIDITKGVPFKIKKI